MRRKRPRSSKVLFATAVLLAVGATIGLRGHLARLEARAAAAGPGRPLVVAERPLTRGEVVEPGDVTSTAVPAAYRPPGALSTAEEAVGRRLAADVAAGEPVTVTRLSVSGGPVAGLIPAGLRAVAVPLAIPPGLLAPGDRVDVLATFGAGQPHTETVVEEAEVLQSLGGPGAIDGVSSLILLVTTEDAERLAFASSFAELSIAVVPAA